MAKYNIMILERMNEDNLIVEAKKFAKPKYPTGGSDGHGDGGIKKPTLRDLILSMQVDINTIKQRLDKIEIRIEKMEIRIEKMETRIEKIETRIDKLESR